MKRFCVRLFGFLLMAIVGVTSVPVAADAALTQAQFTARIKVIKAGIEDIKTLIEEGDYTVTTKLELYQQLILLLQTVDSLERAYVEVRQRDAASRLGQPVASNLISDLELVGVQTQLDFNTFKAEVTEFYPGTTTDPITKKEYYGYVTATSTYMLSKSTRYAADNFRAQVQHAKRQVDEIVAADLGVSVRALASISDISSLDPARLPDQILSAYVNRHVVSEEDFWEEFGIYSIVNEVGISVRPPQEGQKGDGPDEDDEPDTPGAGYINISTDQGEMVQLFIEPAGVQSRQVPKANGTFETETDMTYTIKLNVFAGLLPDDDDYMQRSTESETEGGSTALSSFDPFSTRLFSNTLNNVFEEDAIDFIQEFFKNEDFVEGIDGGIEKLIKFLTTNTTTLLHYYHESRGPALDRVVGVCIPERDRLVLSEFARISMDLMRFQARPDMEVKILHPIAYESRDENPIPPSKCVSVSSYY